MPTFIGLDLAWTTTNNSGICWLEGDSKENLRCTRLEVGPRETMSLSDEIGQVEAPVVVSIDAPIRYTEQRRAENKINSLFGRYKAGAHSAHAAWNRGWKAGVELGDALEQHGFTTDPTALLEGSMPQRSAVEVYPHTIHVRLFGLDERLPYKRRGSKRPVEFRQDVFRRYQDLLTSLIEREAPGILESPDLRRLLDAKTVQECDTHVALNQLDDALDGVTCAMSAWLMWQYPDQWEMIGDENGYIVVPNESVVPVIVPVVSQPWPQLQGPSQDLQVSVHKSAPGIEVQVSRLDDDSAWEIRVRLEGDDLSRVITVVERLE